MDDLDLGPLADLPEGQPALRKSADGRRFVCVRAGGRVAVLDDRCPHEGYPLSGGTVRDGVLTCCWHNWKFELETGACLFGGEPVRRYPVTIDAGRVRIDTRIDPDAERARLEASLRAALRDGSMGSVMRDGLRIAGLDDGALHRALEVVASDAARRAPWGFEHGLAMLADVSTWIDDGLVEAPPAFAAVTSHVAEPLLHAPERARPNPGPATSDVGRTVDARDVLAALLEERRDDAEVAADALVAGDGVCALVDTALVPFLSRDLADYGHGAIYALKARELAGRFPRRAPEIAASVVAATGWVTWDSALPGWGATHDGIRAVERVGDRPIEDAAAYRSAVLASERDAVAACVARLEAGVSPRALLLASARAAAERLRRFDDGWQTRRDAPVTILDVTHALTFAEAAISLTRDRPCSEDAARFALQSAGFVGKLRKADRSDPGGADRSSSAHADLSAALAARDVASARRAADEARFWPTVARFALHEAFVRPIFAAHAVKTTEACRRLEALDPEGRATYRDALLGFVAPRRPERFFGRTAEVAARFLETGRPPPGLY